MNPFTTLPKEILNNILPVTHIGEALVLSVVDKFFQDYVSDKRVWLHNQCARSIIFKYSKQWMALTKNKFKNCELLHDYLCKSIERDDVSFLVFLFGNKPNHHSPVYSNECYGIHDLEDVAERAVKHNAGNVLAYCLQHLGGYYENSLKFVRTGPDTYRIKSEKYMRWCFAVKSFYPLQVYVDILKREGMSLTCDLLEAFEVRPHTHLLLRRKVNYVLAFEEKPLSANLKEGIAEKFRRYPV